MSGLNTCYQANTHWRDSFPKQLQNPTRFFAAVSLYKKATLLAFELGSFILLFFHIDHRKAHIGNGRIHESFHIQRFFRF